MPTLTPANTPLIQQATDSLHRRLRPGRPGMPGRWSAHQASDGETLYVNQILPLVASWSRINDRIAEELFRTVMDLPRPDGLTPARVDAQGKDAGVGVCWPLLVQAARILWEIREDAEFLDAVLPALHRHLEASLDYFCRRPHGWPSWSSPAEAFWPSGFGEHVSSVDLTVMLMNEVQAFQQLSLASRSFTPNREFLDAEFNHLSDILESVHWKAAHQEYRDEQLGGAHRAPTGLMGLFPLTLGDLPVSRRSTLQKKVCRELSLLVNNRNAGTPAARQIPAALQAAILLRGLYRVNDLTGLKAQAGLLLGTRGSIRLPPPRRDASAEGRESSAPMEADTAMLWLELDNFHRVYGSSVAGAWGWVGRMNRISRAVVLALLGLLAAVVLLAPLVYFHKQSVGKPAIETQLGLAKQLELEEQYPEAITLLNTLMESTRGVVHQAVELDMANLYLKSGDLVQAEHYYRDLLARDYETPSLLMNLALTLVKADRFQEAVPYYRRTVDRYGQKYPQLAESAQHSLELLAAEHTMPPDRKEPSDAF